MNMKPSTYNFVFPLDEDMYLLYNALSGGFAKVDSQILDLLDRTEIESSESDESLSSVIDNLKKGKFILENEFDEIGYLKVVTNAKRFASTSLGLTIAPTLECNFACTYCYENHLHVTMNAETVAAVKQFLEIEAARIQGLQITWFGGEPLMALEIIRDISDSILELQKEKEFHFHAGIVTNGYLLTRKRAEQLKEFQVESVQITLDGPPEVHDKRRMLKNGKGTFQRILDNILKVADIFNLAVRVNVDTSNIDRAAEVLDILKAQGLNQRAGVYFAPVMDLGTSCRDVSATCFNYETYSKHEIELYKKAIEKGFGIAKYPQPLLGFCGAVSINSLLIDPYGNLHKCWNTLGVENEAVGKIGEPLKLDPLLIGWLSWDPFQNEECTACRFFPLCMGGCPYLRRNKGANCNTWKYNLEQMLRLYYVSKVKAGE